MTHNSVMRLVLWLGVTAAANRSTTVAALERRRKLGYYMTNSNIKTAVAAWLSNSASAEATYGHISTWETGGVTDMSYLFCDIPMVVDDYWESQGCNLYASSFNEDISAWDTSSVTTMYRMFWGAYSFNQAIGDWRVDKGKNMIYMFADATAFNQDLGWCVGYDVDLGGAFSGTPCEPQYGIGLGCGVTRGDPCPPRTPRPTPLPTHERTPRPTTPRPTPGAPTPQPTYPPGCVNDDSHFVFFDEYTTYNGCYWYDSRPHECGSHDNAHYSNNASEQCCACGGGFWPPTYQPTPLHASKRKTETQSIGFLEILLMILGALFLACCICCYCQGMSEKRAAAARVERQHSDVESTTPTVAPPAAAPPEPAETIAEMLRRAENVSPVEVAPLPSVRAQPPASYPTLTSPRQCSICLEPYSDRVTTLCNHSFCRECITRVIATNPRRGFRDETPCPFCRALVRLRDLQPSAAAAHRRPLERPRAHHERRAAALDAAANRFVNMQRQAMWGTADVVDRVRRRHVDRASEARDRDARRRQREEAARYREAAAARDEAAALDSGRQHATVISVEEIPTATAVPVPPGAVEMVQAHATEPPDQARVVSD